MSAVLIGAYTLGWILVDSRPGVMSGLALLLVHAYQTQRHHHHTVEEAVREARRDPLTGLPTRDVIDQLLHDATRAGTPITVALADVDGLHAVNANLGHAGGDQYLTEVARRLAAAVPQTATLGRMGGDEFALVAPDTDAAALATALGAALAGPATIAGARIQPRASIGIASSNASGSAWHALGCADAAMYAAKEAGGNKVLVYDPDRDGAPTQDGTRPQIRRRDLNPTRDTDVAWTPTGPGDLIPVLVTIDELHLLHEAISQTRNRWDQRATEAQLAADEPTPAAALEATDPGRMNIRPTPAGWRALAARLRAERDRYRMLADRLARVLATVPDTGTGGGIRPVGVVLHGIAAAFTADELDALVITAAEAVCLDLQVLSDRQRHLAYRAYQLLSESHED
ncbi:GGDEF domain-containing protein [Rugosimonospora africana]|uniref:GGDEF domain-containing protein n=1 Tax=Rugosimonospora africana TaxID=556532 RepID=A0A8J3QUN7_9ACTN|nr:GGDEF domain-containing protein [Rugosimonospora africana]GIH16130.1 hypothetical protein Raf01_43020 [Rugosimonospora africana]